MSSSNRVAIVTGGSRGIGAAVAARLARAGLAVVVNYLGGTVKAAALAGQIEAADGRAIAVKGDVADPAAVKALFDAAEQTFGGADELNRLGDRVRAAFPHSSGMGDLIHPAPDA